MYYDRSGRPIDLIDRTQFPYNLIDAVRRIIERAKSKLRPGGYKGTGRYVACNGKWVLIDRSASVPDLWIKKFAFDGDKDRAEGYKRMEERGTLHAVNDRECWQEYADR